MRHLLGDRNLVYRMIRSAAQPYKRGERSWLTEVTSRSGSYWARTHLRRKSFGSSCTRTNTSNSTTSSSSDTHVPKVGEVATYGVVTETESYPRRHAVRLRHLPCAVEGTLPAEKSRTATSRS